MKKEWVKKTITTAFVAVLMLVVLAGVGKAQTESGQIIGNVTDPNGALGSGASVSVKSVGTGRTITTTSDAQGVYTVTALQPGLYDVTVTSGNFKPSTQRVQVTVGSKVSVETQLSHRNAVYGIRFGQCQFRGATTRGKWSVKSECG